MYTFNSIDKQRGKKKRREANKKCEYIQCGLCFSVVFISIVLVIGLKWPDNENPVYLNLWVNARLIMKLIRNDSIVPPTGNLHA